MYPVFLNLEGKRCVVVGGGEVALRKVKALLGCSGRVKVISPEVIPTLRELMARTGVEYLARAYREGDLEGAFLVICATDDPHVNELAAREASRKGILHNVVDRPELCDFIVPSVLRRGDLCVAISTGGKSPAFARRIREELEEIFGPEYELAVSILGILRERIIAEGWGTERNREFFLGLTSKMLDLCRRKDRVTLDTILRGLLHEDAGDKGVA